MILVGWIIGCFVGWGAAMSIIIAIPGDQGLMAFPISAALTIIGGVAGMGFTR